MSLAKATSKRVAHPDQPRHRIRRRAIHPDFSVPIHRHEAERRIDRIADDGGVKAVALDDGLPVAHRRSPQGIDTDLHAGGADRLHVDDIGKVSDIGRDVIMAMHVRRLARALIGDALDAGKAVLEIAVRGALDGRRDVGIRRTAIGRVILEAAVFRRVVRRRDHDAIGKAICSALVMAEDRPRDHRRRRVAALGVDHHLDPVRREHLERARQRRFRQRMGVDADEQRAGKIVVAAMLANRLADRENMRLVKGIVERRAAMPRGAERHPLRRHLRIGLTGKIGRHQPRNIRQHRRGGGLAGERIDLGGHFVSSRIRRDDPARQCKEMLRAGTRDHRHPPSRHGERSDAIHARGKQNGLLRRFAPRNDGW